MVWLTGICAVIPPPETGVLTPGMNTSRRTGALVVFDESRWAKATEPHEADRNKKYEATHSEKIVC